MLLYLSSLLQFQVVTFVGLHPHVNTSRRRTVETGDNAFTTDAELMLDVDDGIVLVLDGILTIGVVPDEFSLVELAVQVGNARQGAVARKPVLGVNGMAVGHDLQEARAGLVVVALVVDNAEHIDAGMNDDAVLAFIVWHETAVTSHNLSIEEHLVGAGQIEVTAEDPRAGGDAGDFGLDRVDDEGNLGDVLADNPVEVNLLGDALGVEDDILVLPHGDSLQVEGVGVKGLEIALNVGERWVVVGPVAGGVDQQRVTALVGAVVHVDVGSLHAVARGLQVLVDVGIAHLGGVGGHGEELIDTVVEHEMVGLHGVHVFRVNNGRRLRGMGVGLEGIDLVFILVANDDDLNAIRLGLGFGLDVGVHPRIDLGRCVEEITAAEAVNGPYHAVLAVVDNADGQHGHGVDVGRLLAVGPLVIDADADVGGVRVVGLVAEAGVGARHDTEDTEEDEGGTQLNHEAASFPALALSAFLDSRWLGGVLFSFFAAFFSSLAAALAAFWAFFSSEAASLA